MRISKSSNVITLIGDNPVVDRPVLQKLLEVTRCHLFRRSFAVFIDGKMSRFSYREDAVPYVELYEVFESVVPFLEQVGISFETDSV